MFIFVFSIRGMLGDAPHGSYHRETPGNAPHIFYHYGRLGDAPRGYYQRGTPGNAPHVFYLRGTLGNAPRGSDHTPGYSPHDIPIFPFKSFFCPTFCWTVSKALLPLLRPRQGIG
jgi:hypothetical protein